MREHHITVPRTARYATLGGAAASAGDVWFVCHGYGQLALRFLEDLEPLADGGRLVVAPEGLSRFYLSDAPGEHGAESKVGASWMTREDRLTEIEDYVRYLDLLYREVLAGVDRARFTVSVLGFSQGVATACRWVARGGSNTDRLILWGGYLPPEFDEAKTLGALQDLEITMVHGTADPYAPAERVAGEERRLARLGLQVRLVTFDGGHRLDAPTLAALAAR